MPMTVARVTNGKKTVSILTSINCLKRPKCRAISSRCWADNWRFADLPPWLGWMYPGWMQFFDRCDRPTARNIAQLPTFFGKLVRYQKQHSQELQTPYWNFLQSKQTGDSTASKFASAGKLSQFPILAGLSGNCMILLENLFVKLRLSTRCVYKLHFCIGSMSRWRNQLALSSCSGSTTLEFSPTGNQLLSSQGYYPLLPWVGYCDRGQ